MTIICYVRPWFKRYFKDVCNLAFPEERVEYASDFLGQGTVGLAEKFYEHYNNQNLHSSDIDFLDPDVFQDVYLRCRLLRNLTKLQANKLCRAMWSAINDIFDDVKPDIVISITVDSYVTDLMRIQCIKKNIPFIGLVKSFLNGYFRVTSRGEMIKLREPSNQEVSTVMRSLLDNNYRPDFIGVKKNGFRYRMKAWENQLKSILRSIYFSCKRKIGKDKLCYHYWTSQMIKYKSFGFFHSYSGDNFWEEKIKSKRFMPKVFIPLQFVPEATVDYWCPNKEMIDYSENLIKAVRVFCDKGFLILIKEHPGVIGLRDYSLYKALSHHENVIVIPPQISANGIVKICDCVLVWTGTVGFEAALRGVPVIHLGFPYYIHKTNFFGVESMSKLPEVIDQVMASNITPISEDEQFDMVRHVLSGCLPGSFYYKEREMKKISEKLYIQNVMQVASGINNFLKCFEKPGKNGYSK